MFAAKKETAVMPPPLTVVPSTEKPFEPRRVQQADFLELSMWLIPRLVEKYPRSTPESLSGWLISTVTTYSFAFFRSKNAALLVELRLEPLEPAGIVRERFLRLRSLKSDALDVRKAHYEEGLGLYKLAANWAKSIKAVRLEYGMDSDLPDQYMYENLSDAKKKQYYSLTF